MTKLEIKRKEKGFTQQEMAQGIDVSIGCYNMYENNQRRIPNDKAEKIAKILKCKMNSLFVPSSFTVSEKIVKEAEWIK